MNEEQETKILLNRGVKYLNRLTCEWEDKNLQELLYYYNKCKNDVVKLRKAITILSNLTVTSWIDLFLIEDMKKVSKK